MRGEDGDKICESARTLSPNCSSARPFSSLSSDNVSLAAKQRTISRRCASGALCKPSCRRRFQWATSKPAQTSEQMMFI